MSSAHNPAPSPAQTEELLGALEGVVSAHVVTESGGRIVEIHILATPAFHPKQVVRNVESALSAGLGIAIDRRVVSVAQIRTPGADAAARADDPDTAAGGGDATSTNGRVVAFTAPEADVDAEGVEDTATRRLEYVRYEARRDAGSCTVEVVLRDGGEEITGRGVGPDTAAGRAEAAARAVMAGIGQARAEIRFTLEGAVLTTSRGRGFVIVSAHAIQDRVTVPLAGAAPVTRSPEEAAILAALQATNRWSG